MVELGLVVSALASRKITIEMNEDSRLLTSIIGVGKIGEYISNFLMSNGLRSVEYGDLNYHTSNSYSLVFIVGLNDAEKYLDRILNFKKTDEHSSLSFLYIISDQEIGCKTKKTLTVARKYFDVIIPLSDADIDLNNLRSIDRIREKVYWSIFGMVEIANYHGLICVDYADICVASRNMGFGSTGHAVSIGNNATTVATYNALSSLALTGFDAKLAKGIIISLVTGIDIEVPELEHAASIISNSLPHNAILIMGTIIDNTLEAGVRKVILTATGQTELFA